MKISQACYDTGDNHERAVLQKLLVELKLEGMVIQADALHTQRPFFGSSRSRAGLIQSLAQAGLPGLPA